MTKNLLLIGLSGSGKSTTGNCIISKKGDIEYINSRPFGTSDKATSCTSEFKCATNDDKTIAILDTVGFGDPSFDPEYILSNLKTGLKQLNNQVDCVIFVAQKGRFTKELVEFFELTQEHVLKNKCIQNSLLIVTNCEKGWILDQTDSYLQRALINCSGLYYEFKLKFDDDDDDKDDREKNKGKRQKAIDSLADCIASLNFKKIDLSYVHSTEYELYWKETITPLFKKLFAIGGGIIGVVGIATGLGLTLLKK